MGKSSACVRVGIIVAAIGILAGFLIFRSATIWQYEEVDPGKFYRTAFRSDHEFVNAAAKAHCASVAVVGTPEEQEGELLNRAIQYAYRNQLRDYRMVVPPGELPKPQDIRDFLAWTQRKGRQPVLLGCVSGERSGMLTAAYRLSMMNMPLAQVLEHIDRADLPDQVRKSVRDFAQRYAAAMERPSTQPTTAPAAQ